MAGFMKLLYLILFWNAVHVSKGWENLSLLPKYKGEASMKPFYKSYDRPPEKAVDGFLEEDRGESTCSFTWAYPSVKEAWWKLPLKLMSNVAYLEIYFRSATVNRHVGFSVFVFNNSSYIPPSNLSQHKVFTHNISTCPEHVTNVTINKEIQGIALYNSKDPPVSTSCTHYEPSFATIEICEVKVMGCPFQHYGENCTPCDLKCRNKHCDAFNGSCTFGCIDNVVKSPDCTVCKEGFYGQVCEKACGNCRNGTLCNITTGVCPDGCEDNWDGLMCTVCSDGYYGYHCKNICGHCLTGTSCDKSTGVCPRGCNENWSGPKCDELSSTENLHPDSGISKASTAIISVVSTLVFVTFIYAVLTRIVHKKLKQRNAHTGKDATDIIIRKTYDQITDTNIDHTYQKMNSKSDDSHYQEMHIYKNDEFVADK